MGNDHSIWRAGNQETHTSAEGYGHRSYEDMADDDTYYGIQLYYKACHREVVCRYVAITQERLWLDIPKETQQSAAHSVRRAQLAWAKADSYLMWAARRLGSHRELAQRSPDDR